MHPLEHVSHLESWVSWFTAQVSLSSLEAPGGQGQAYSCSWHSGLHRESVQADECREDTNASMANPLPGSKVGKSEKVSYISEEVIRNK